MTEELKALSPIRRSVWIRLKEYALEKTRETEGRKITLSSVIEKAITDLADKELKGKRKRKI